MRNLILSASELLNLPAMSNTIGGKRTFLGTFSASSWGSSQVASFLSKGSVACIGTNQAMKANLYINAAGDTICIEW
jgi:hypothetical protein